MSDKTYFVVVRPILKHAAYNRRRVTRDGPYPYSEAVAVRDAHAAALSARKRRTYRVYLEEDRTAYYASYFKKRYRDEPDYRERRKKRAVAHTRKKRAERRGDFSQLIAEYS